MNSRRYAFSRLQLFAMASFATYLLCPSVEAGMMHADVDQRTYTDFAQNLGRYKVTGVSTLLQAIRVKDGGIVLVNKDGQMTGKISLEQGMINFSGVEDMPDWFHGAGGALGNNFIVTAEHNSIFNASFGVSELGSSHAISYATVRESTGRGDFALYRQNKIFTDVVGASVYSGITTDTEASSLLGKTIYRAGAGVHYKYKDHSGTRVHASKNYTFLAGGMGVISGASFGGYESTDTYRISWGMELGADGVNESNPIPITTNGGDSGSPIYIYNETTGKYEYLFALTGDNRQNWSIGSGAIKWTADAMAEFNKAVDMSTVVTASLGVVSAATEERAATGSIVVGGQTIEFLGVASGTHTWKSLSNRKDTQNWYAYGNDYQNGINGLGNTHNLVFTGSGSGKEHTVSLSATVDTGIGYLEFNKGKFTIDSASGQNYMLNSAGYVINEDAEVHLKLTNESESYMREWRKNGEGDLYIEGSGNTNALLTVGGSGKVYLHRDGGYSGYNVLASSGATVIIKDKNQIARDFTFGLGGATLDMNGNSMDWYTTNSNVAADGFSINALTDEAVITNTGTQETTLTYKQGGTTNFKGSFNDTTSGAIKVVADAGTDSVWTLNSIVTDLSKNSESSFEVKSGKVILAGTNTVHGKGSVNYSADVFFSEDDWHYADSQMNVTVQNGSTFELGSHARLKGDISVNGGTYIMREGVRHQMEYIEGGLIKEDTYAWRNYYGHHGNTVLNNGTLNVSFSAGTTANTTYTGNITGTGTISVDAADGSLTLTGDNTFEGERSVVGGTLIVEDAAAAGTVKWTVGEKGVFHAQNATGAEMLTYIDQTSNGVLALGKDDVQVNLSSHKNLIVGALAGTKINYGAEGTSETLNAVDNVWRLGGGGGNLVVNYRLTGDNKLVLGNAHTKGIVTLANTQNDFTGGIDFFGSGVTLEYSSEAAIKNVTLNLSYGNRVAMTGLLGNIAKTSDGILLQYNASQDLDLSAHQNLSLGANGDLDYTGKITVADNQAYRFSAASGTLTVNSEIGGAKDIVVDAQTYTGGTVKLNNLKNFTGALSVMGYDGSKTENKTGTITLEVTQDNALDNASSVTLKAGGTLYIGETTQRITNFVSEVGSILKGDQITDRNDTKASEIHLTINSLSEIKGTVDVATIHKYGKNTLELNNSLLKTSSLQYSTLVIEEGDVRLMETYAKVGVLNIKGSTLDVNGKFIFQGTVIGSDGAEIDVSTSGSTIGDNCTVVASEGIVTVNNGNNDVSIRGIISAAEGAVLKLTGTGNWEFAAGGYNNLGNSVSPGILQVEAPTLKFTSSYDSLLISGTLQLLSSGNDSGVSIDFSGGGTSSSQNFKINRLLINNKNLTLDENSKKNAIFTIGSLSGSGTVTWNADLNTSTNGTADSSRLVLNGEGDFSGTVTAKRVSNGNNYNTFVELAHEKALQNAILDLQGISGSSVSLAVNTAKAQIQGLTGNENSVVYGGAASATALSEVQTTNAATLMITGSGTYDYKGAVAGASIAMNGTGTQTFSGTGVVVADISALSGTLNFASAPKLSGNITIAQGATLKLGESFSLDTGHTLAVFAGTNGEKSKLTSALVLNGGELRFDASILNETNSSLDAEISFGSTFSVQMVSFSNESLLEIGKTYKLLDGDWSGKTATVTNEMPDYLKASTFTADANGLSVTLSLADGFAEWKNVYDVFASDKTVLFRDVSSEKSLNFSTAVSATGARFVNGKSYTFSGSDVTLSGELVMTSGKLTLNNKLTALSYENAGGELEIGTGGTLAITETKSGDVTIENISGTGTLHLTLENSNYNNTLKVDSDFAGTTHIQSGNFNLDKSTFGRTLRLANGVNAQISSATTIAGNLEFEGASQIHQNSGNSLTIDGVVSGTSGTWERRGGGTLTFNNSVNLAGFDTGSNGTTNNFNGDTTLGVLTVDQKNISLSFNALAKIGTLTVGSENSDGSTVSFNGGANIGTLTVGVVNSNSSVAGTINFNGESVADTVSVNNPSAILGGSGTLSVKHLSHNVSSTLNLDGLRLNETEVQNRSWSGNNTTTINLKNGAVLDTRLSDYSVYGVMIVGGDVANGTMLVSGIQLSPDANSYGYGSRLNVNSGASLVITGDASGSVSGDFVLAAYGEKHRAMGHSNIISVDGRLTSNASMSLMHNNATLNVNGGGELNLLKGLNLTGACKGDITGNAVNATLNIASGGKLYAAGGEQHNNLLVSLAENTTLGAIGAANSEVSFSNNMSWGTAGKTGMITIDTAATTADNDFSLDRSETEGVTVALTGTLNLQGQTSLEVVGAGTLKYNSAFNKASEIRVQKASGLMMSGPNSITTGIELNEGSLILESATVSGEKSSVTINTAGTLKATGTSTIATAITLNNGSSVICDVSTGATLASTTALGHTGARGSLEKIGMGTLTLNDSNAALVNITASEGILNVYGVNAFMLSDLTLGNAIAGFYKNVIDATVANANEEADIQITGTALFSAGAHLNANLILSGGSTLEVADGGLSMGSTVTLERGVILGEETLARANALGVGERLILFTSVDGLVLKTQEGTDVMTYKPGTLLADDGTSANLYFSNLSPNHALIFSEENGGAIALLMIPEPSVFGMLVGVGALVSVVSRRRRTRK